MFKKEKTGVYLWKLVLIILAIFVVFISIECFLLIERTAKKIISGFSKELGTSIVAELDENLKSQENNENELIDEENSDITTEIDNPNTDTAIEKQNSDVAAETDNPNTNNTTQQINLDEYTESEKKINVFRINTVKDEHGGAVLVYNSDGEGEIKAIDAIKEADTERIERF